MKLCQSCKRVFVTERDFLKGTSRWRLASDDRLYFNCSCGAVVRLEKQNSSWFSHKKFMSRGAASLFDKVFPNADAVPRVSACAAELMELLSSGTSTTLEMSRALRKDPLLAAGILRAANAAVGVAAESSFKSIEQALNFLGRDTVSRLTSSASVAQFDFKTKAYTAEVHWFESYLRGYVAERLARSYALQLPADLCYLSGVFMNVGKCIGALVLPDEIDRAYEACQSKEKNWTWAESEFHLNPHEVLGEIASVVWGLPTECAETVSSHHHVLELKSRSCITVAAVCSFANQVAHLLNGQGYRTDPLVLESCVSAFRLRGKADLDRLVHELEPLLDRAQRDTSSLVNSAA